MTSRSRALFWFGLALFAASFFLPALWPDKPPREMFSVSEPIPGWGACLFGWTVLTDAPDAVGVLLGVTCLTNVAMLVAAAAARVRGPSRFVARMLWICAAYDLAWMFVAPVAQFGPGYFAWIASFVAVGLALRPASDLASA